MKTVIFLIFISACFGFTEMGVVFAQEEFEDFFDSADDEFKKLKDQADDEFSRLKKSVDDEFGELLSSAWREFELARGLVRDETPKPETPPVLRPQEERETPAPEPEPSPETPPSPPPKEPEQPSPVPEEALHQPKPEEPHAVPQEIPQEQKKPPAQIPGTPPQPSRPPVKPGEPLSFIFYNTSLHITYDRLWKVDLTGDITPKSIRSFWEFYSKTDYRGFIEQAVHIRQQMELNDWGYCLLLDSISEGIYGRSSRLRPLFIWFMLVQSGYDARVGFNDNTAYLLIPSHNTVYSAPFYELDNVKYYITFLGLGTEQREMRSLYTYEGKHREAEDLIDFTLDRSPAIDNRPDIKNLSFIYAGKTYRVPVQVNNNVIDFFGLYPQVDLDVYFGAPVSSVTGPSLLESLMPIVRDKPEDEAVSVLLRFVQTALDYQTDDEQFGRENYLFPEETLFYPYSDCEDRSFLFAYLVTNILGLDVVGLQYPGHVAAAVKFTTDVEGDAITFDNARYVICDPTYINANPGECMPKYRTVAPGVIKVNRARSSM